MRSGCKGKKELMYLIELEKDFEKILYRSERGMELYRENIEAMLRLRMGIEAFQNSAGNKPSVNLDSLALDLGQFASGWVPAGPAPFYSEMKASGLLVIFKNKELSRQPGVYDNASRVGSEGFRTLRD